MHLAQHLRSAIAVAALSVLVAGCSSVKLDDEQKPAPIVDASKGAGDGADARAVVPVAADSTRGIDPFTDPNNPLSKKSVYFDFDSFVVKSEYQPLVEAHGKVPRGQHRASDQDRRQYRRTRRARIQPGAGPEACRGGQAAAAADGCARWTDRDREFRQGKAARHRQHRGSVGAEPARGYRVQVTLLVYATRKARRTCTRSEPI